MSTPSRDVPQPPQPPKFERKLHFYPFQLIGIPILFLIPILALFGVFGKTSTSVENSGSGLSLHVDYANRVLYQDTDGTEIRVQNTSDQPYPMLTVAIEKQFLDNYSDISFMPEIDEITNDAYFIRFEDVQPGETHIVKFDSKGKVAGQHRGMIIVNAGGEDEPVIASSAVTLETLIIP
jgi:hypothetical protein